MHILYQMSAELSLFLFVCVFMGICGFVSFLYMRYLYVPKGTTPSYLGGRDNAKQLLSLFRKMTDEQIGEELQALVSRCRSLHAGYLNCATVLRNEVYALEEARNKYYFRESGPAAATALADQTSATEQAALKCESAHARALQAFATLEEIQTSGWFKQFAQQSQNETLCEAIRAITRAGHKEFFNRPPAHLRPWC